MKTSEKVALFERIGIVHVFPSEEKEFKKQVSQKGILYQQVWDQGLRVYVFMKP